MKIKNVLEKVSKKKENSKQRKKEKLITDLKKKKAGINEKRQK